MSETDRIEKIITLRTPRSRVWRAISDPAEFGTWFRARIEGAFVEGALVAAESIWPGHEGMRWDMRIEKMEPESLFVFRWPADEASRDPDEWNRVEFRLEEVPEGTRLVLTESGFDRLPPERRAHAHRDNEGGWTLQMENIRKHVEV